MPETWKVCTSQYKMGTKASFTLDWPFSEGPGISWMHLRECDDSAPWFCVFPYRFASFIPKHPMQPSYATWEQPTVGIMVSSRSPLRAETKTTVLHKY